MYTIIGFGPTAVAAAESIRKNDPDNPITIIGKESYDFYSRILLENVASGNIPSENIFLKKDDFYEENGIERIKGRKVEGINVNDKIVLLDDGRSLGYEKLLIATGARSKKFPMFGNIEGIFNLYTLEDSLTVNKYYENVKNAVVIGAGFVGTDWLKSLIKKGINTTLLVRGKGMFSGSLPSPAVDIIQEKIKEKGVNIVLEDEIESIKTDEDRIKTIITKKGRELDCDLLGLGIGVERNIDFLKNTPIKTNIGILTSQFLKTNINDIYSAGDVAEYFDVYTKKYRVTGLWQNALVMGKIAGANMAGGNLAFKQVFFQALNLFDIGYYLIGLMPGEIEGASVEEEADDDLFIQKHIKDGALIGAVLVGKNASLLASKMKSDIEANLEKFI